MKVVPFAAAAFLLLVPPFTAAASIGQVVSISTAQNRVMPRGKLNQGWWEETTAPQPNNDNYATGVYGPGYREHRGYLSFYLGGIDKPVRSASLRIQRGSRSSSPYQETLGIYDVTTPISSLYRTGVIDPLVFADLGAGKLFASPLVSAAEVGGFVESELNEDAINVINSSQTDYFSVGMAIIGITQERQHLLFPL